MKRTRYQIIIGVVAGLITLAGCKSNEQAASPPQPLPPVNSPSAAQAPTADNGVTALQGVISNTRTAVQAGDFNKAKGEFEKFEDTWKTVEDGIKKKAPSTYEAIEANSDKVTDALKSSNKDRSLSALQALSQQVSAVPKS